MLYTRFLNGLIVDIFSPEGIWPHKFSTLLEFSLEEILWMNRSGRQGQVLISLWVWRFFGIIHTTVTVTAKRNIFTLKTLSCVLKVKSNEMKKSTSCRVNYLFNVIIYLSFSLSGQRNCRQWKRRCFPRLTVTVLVVSLAQNTGVMFFLQPGVYTDRLFTSLHCADLCTIC